MTTEAMYRALVRLWHRPTKRSVMPGEVVSLHHLNDAEVRMLVAAGYVEPVGDEAEEEETNAEDTQDANADCEDRP